MYRRGRVLDTAGERVLSSGSDVPGARLRPTRGAHAAARRNAETEREQCQGALNPYTPLNFLPPLPFYVLREALKMSGEGAGSDESGAVFNLSHLDAKQFASNINLWLV